MHRRLAAISICQFVIALLVIALPTMIAVFLNFFEYDAACELHVISRASFQLQLPLIGVSSAERCIRTSTASSSSA